MYDLLFISLSTQTMNITWLQLSLGFVMTILSIIVFVWNIDQSRKKDLKKSLQEKADRKEVDKINKSLEQKADRKELESLQGIMLLHVESNERLIKSFEKQHDENVKDTRDIKNDIKNIISSVGKLEGSINNLNIIERK